MKKIQHLTMVLVAVLSGCASVPERWNKVDEADYQPYLAGGTGKISGEAYLNVAFHGMHKASGRTITLDPATKLGRDWWSYMRVNFLKHTNTPPSLSFSKARRTTIADENGKFEFSGLAAGDYHIHTTIRWGTRYNWRTGPDKSDTNGPLGGILGGAVQVREGKVTSVILNQYMNSLSSTYFPAPRP